MSATEVRDRLGLPAWRSLFSFCVERNPWDKVLSHFHMVKARSGHDLLFDDYIEKGEFPVDFDIYSVRGEVVVDRVLRYEALEEELDAVLYRFGVPYEGRIGVYAKSSFRTNRSPYQSYYDSWQVDIVAKKFGREIKLFGYVFE